ncbi:hypothetical protein B9Z55_023657 [Caenorhabditis nigoni]|uniref:Uncharacterized protein n=1 Tax=Caenorhabditis nigoni TaxID=1611254 RepID=A0A2G5SQV3_9PELO|nr:hypothetical protein B9Z55_023657 [Caenorhabditis nigoni]
MILLVSLATSLTKPTMSEDTVTEVEKSTEDVVDDAQKVAHDIVDKVLESMAPPVVEEAKINDKKEFAKQLLEILKEPSIDMKRVKDLEESGESRSVLEELNFQIVKRLVSKEAEIEAIKKDKDAVEQSMSKMQKEFDEFRKSVGTFQPYEKISNLAEGHFTLYKYNLHVQEKLQHADRELEIIFNKLTLLDEMNKQKDKVENDKTQDKQPETLESTELNKQGKAKSRQPKGQQVVSQPGAHPTDHQQARVVFAEKTSLARPALDFCPLCQSNSHWLMACKRFKSTQERIDGFRRFQLCRKCGERAHGRSITCKFARSKCTRCIRKGNTDPERTHHLEELCFYGNQKPNYGSKRRYETIQTQQQTQCNQNPMNMSAAAVQNQYAQNPVNMVAPVPQIQQQNQQLAFERQVPIQQNMNQMIGQQQIQQPHQMGMIPQQMQQQFLPQQPHNINYNPN